MEVWEIIVVPLLTAILVAATRPLEVFAMRKRMGAVNSTRVIAEFMIRSLDKLGEQEALRKEIESWLSHPNSLGSEAALGVLLARLCVATNPTEREVRRVDRALNALDQRATERERVHTAGIRFDERANE